MFNPFKYRYNANFLQEEGIDAIVKLNKGSVDREIRIPRALIPKEIQPGQNFTLTFQPQDAAKTDETKALKDLLQELIE
jgi:hypothetical protein